MGNKRQTVLVARLLERALEGRARVTTSGPSDDPIGTQHHTVLVSTGDDHPPAALVPTSAGAGYPQDVRRLLPHLAAISRPATPVVVARRMSPGARELLRDENLSWADESGNVRIAVGPVVVAIDVPDAPAAPSDAAATGWAEASGALAELMLGRAARGEPREPLEAVTALASRLGVSAPLVSRNLQRFDALGWTRRSGPNRGPHVVRHLTDPGAMLSSWAAWRTSRRPTVTTAHGLVPDVDAWLLHLRDVWPAQSWAVTGEAAAQVRAPYLSRVSVVELYVDPSTYDDALDVLLERAELELVPTGGRIRLLRADPYLSRLVADDDAHGDVPLVPDVRLYADLLAGGVRGGEAADELRDRRLGF